MLLRGKFAYDLTIFIQYIKMSWAETPLTIWLELGFFSSKKIKTIEKDKIYVLEMKAFIRVKTMSASH